VRRSAAGAGLLTACGIKRQALLDPPHPKHVSKVFVRSGRIGHQPCLISEAMRDHDSMKHLLSGMKLLGNCTHLNLRSQSCASAQCFHVAHVAAHGSNPAHSKVVNGRVSKY
jgi:hypothetical protein